MSEFKEGQHEQEISSEDFKTQVVERIDNIWLKYGWSCQKEITFTDKIIKPASTARVLERPTDLNDPSQKFKAIFYIAENSNERENIAKTLDFLIPHEVAHNIQGLHKDKYEMELSKEQIDDLNQSQHINPEDFYSGANEISTDIIALEMAENQEKSIESLIVHLEQDMAREKAGELQPFFRDQARFEVLLNYLSNNRLIGEDDLEKLNKIINFWGSERKNLLDEKDQNRFSQMKAYLIEIIERVKMIKL